MQNPIVSVIGRNIQKISEHTYGSHIHMALMVDGNHEEVDAYLDNNGVWSYKTTASEPERVEYLVNCFNELY